MGWFIAGLLVGAVVGAVVVWMYLRREVEAVKPEVVERDLGSEADIYEAYREDLLRQLRNMSRYDGTERGQEDRA